MECTASGERVTGYLHRTYAESLCEFGKPYHLPESGGWLLVRTIPDTPWRDGMGCYPLFACQNWAALVHDLERLHEELVSLALVTDPFGGYSLPLLQRTFDQVIPYKEHFVIETGRPLHHFVAKHHRYYVRKAAAQVNVELCTAPLQHLNEWLALYDTLKERHQLHGMKAFSAKAFAQQLTVPGIVLFRALHQGVTVGLHLWYLQGEVAYSHLQASSPLGYTLMATYPLYAFAIEWLSARVAWIHLGAGAGSVAKRDDGLSRFKQGWATGTRPAYFCTNILQPARYQELSQPYAATDSAYFPLYRKGELA